MPALSHPPALMQVRPKRTTVVQRAGVDLALVAFAVLAWWQLRQYSSPLAGVVAIICPFRWEPVAFPPEAGANVPRSDDPVI